LNSVGEGGKTIQHQHWEGLHGLFQWFTLIWFALICTNARLSILDEKCPATIRIRLTVNDSIGDQ